MNLSSLIDKAKRQGKVHLLGQQFSEAIRYQLARKGLIVTDNFLKNGQEVWELTYNDSLDSKSVPSLNLQSSRLSIEVIVLHDFENFKEDGAQLAQIVEDFMTENSKEGEIWEDLRYAHLLKFKAYPEINDCYGYVQIEFLVDLNPLAQRPRLAEDISTVLKDYIKAVSNYDVDVQVSL